MIHLLISISLAISCGFAHAESEIERKVTLDWESVPDANSYDIEIGHFGKTQVVKSEANLPKNRWVGILSPGKWWMRVRARDERGIPGDWSEPTELQIKLPRVEVIRPSSDSILNSNSTKHSVLFEWKPTRGAKAYTVYVETDQGKAVESIKVEGTSARIDLPSVAKYRWSVQALDLDGRAGDRETAFSEFTIEGPALEPPVIRKPETIYLRQVEFVRPSGAESVNIRVERYDNEKRDWVVLKEWEETSERAFDFSQEWQGGRYQVIMRSSAKHRAQSQPAQVTFDVYSGERTPTLESQALLRRSLNRTEGWFSQASYIVTQVAYEGVNYQTGVRPKFRALSGTANVSVARFSDSGLWGAYFGISLGGILLNGKNTILLGAQGLGIFRYNFGYSGELRLLGGLARRDLPEASGKSGDSFKITRMELTEAKLGVEYWQALTRKAGLQIHSYYAQSLYGQSSFTNKIYSGHSIELGVLSSYRWSPDTTWLLGITSVTDEVSYPGRNESTGAMGTNEINQSAQYLHLMVEYDF